MSVYPLQRIPTVTMVTRISASPRSLPIRDSPDALAEWRCPRRAAAPRSTSSTAAAPETNARAILDDWVPAAADAGLVEISDQRPRDAGSSGTVR